MTFKSKEFKIYFPTLRFYQFLFIYFLIVFSIFINWFKPSQLRHFNSSVSSTKKIFVSFSVLEDIVKTLSVGSKNIIELQSLINHNSDHHHVNLHPKQIKALRSADLILFSGFNFESEISKVLDKDKTIKISYVTQMQSAPPFELINNDPHIWLSLKQSKIYVKNVYQILLEKELVEKDILDQNLALMLSQISEIEAKLVRPQFIKAPVLLSSYSILNYFSKEIHFEFISLNQDHHSSNLSAKDYKKIIDRIKSKDIEYIASELHTDSKILVKLQREHKLKKIGPFCIDSLSDKNGPCTSYLKMLKHNYEALSLGLQQ